MKADSSLIALQILAAGHGSAIISRSFARQCLETGTLIAPVPFEMPMSHRFFLVRYHDMKNSAEIDTFQDRLIAQRF
jgi:LysR family glycine cleavage system transcriptional activator